MIINKFLFLKMSRSSFKLVFFFLVIIPNLVISLNKEQDCTCNRNADLRIVGGSRSESSGMAALFRNGYINLGLTIQEQNLMKIEAFLCSAFVLNEQWVMTTKECTEEIYRNNTAVGVGYDKVEMYDERIDIRNVINREGFDMSLIELEDPIDLNRFKPVCLDDKRYIRSPPVENYIGAGFGKIYPQKQVLEYGELTTRNLTNGDRLIESTYLREIGLVDDDKECDNEFKLCVKSAGRKRKGSYDVEGALCFGDEGGPLYYAAHGKRFVVGLLIEIISYKNENGIDYFCGGDGKATYLKIEPHINWIKEHLGEDNYCNKEWADMETERIMVNLAIKRKNEMGESSK